MYRKLLISIGTIAAGMAWSGEYDKPRIFEQGVATSQPFEIAQSSGSGGSTGGGTTSGGTGGRNVQWCEEDPSLGHKGPGNMDTGTGKNRYRGDVGMGGATGKGATDSAIRPGDGGSNSPGSAGRSGSSDTGGSSGGSGSGAGHKRPAKVGRRPG